MRFLYLLAGLCLSVGLTAQTNLLTNGEFDDGLTAWRTVTTGEGQVDVAVVDTATLSGTNAVRLENTVPGVNPFSTGLAQLVPIDAAAPARYRITFLARAEAGRSIVFQYKVGDQSLYYETQQLTTETQEFTFEFERSTQEDIELLFFTGIETPAVYLDAVSLVELAPASPINMRNGSYDQVAVGGGGYVTGVHYHPTTCGLLYMRTDVGGLFRYDYERGEWILLFDDFMLEQENYFGINALALAPSNDSVIYVAADKAEYFSGPSDVLVSYDRGASWEPTGLNKRFFGFGEPFAKAYGPAIAVDPEDANRVYASTINNGLWYKDGREADWEKVEGIPNGQANVGVKSIVFGPDSLYVGVRREGIFVRGLSGGGSFTPIAGAPTELLEMDVDGSGRIFVAAEDGLYTYGTDGNWTTTRAGDAFSSVSVHPDGSGRVVALETLFGAGQGDILYSTDNGENWTVRDYRREDFPAWYPPFFWSNAGSSITFDPCTETAVTYADFFAVWHTEDIAVQPSVWSTYSEGHEETYVTDIMAPPMGHRLYASFADVLGFSWEDDVTEFPDSTLVGDYDFRDDPFLNNGSSLDYSGGQPGSKVFAANINNFGGQGYLLRSDDEFATYTLRTAPGSMGRVAMSADDPDNMVVYTVGAESGVYFTTDGGASWQPSAGAPTGISDNFFRSANALAADRVLPGTFYVYEQPGRIYASEDGGATFTQISTGLPTNVPFDGYEIKARPGVAGELWASLDAAGLYRSTDGGRNFTRIEAIERSVTFGFGAGREAGDATAVYVYGVADGREGLFFTGDAGAEWTQVGIATTWPNGPRALAADLQDFGRVYIGSDGSGILYVTLTSDTGSTSVHPAGTPPAVAGLVAYPNPTGEEMQLRFSSIRSFDGRLEWRAASGQLLRNQAIRVAIGENTVTASLGGLPAGVLFATVSGPEGTTTIRVVHR